jgi:hypothetical protein
MLTAVRADLRGCSEVGWNEGRISEGFQGSCDTPLLQISHCGNVRRSKIKINKRPLQECFLELQSK